MPRISFLTGLATAIVLLVGSLAVAPESAKAQERPFKGRMAGNAMLTPTDDPCVMHNNAAATGNATHTGQFTWATEEEVDFCVVPGGVEVEGTFTMTTANGDLIQGQFAAIGYFDETGTLLIEGDYEIIGGSGRFTGATGSGDTEVTAFFFPGLPFVAALDGTINY